MANNNAFQGAPIGSFTPQAGANAIPEYAQRFGYNIFNTANNLGSRPYQAYNQQITAPLSAQQQQAYSNISANQGAWKPELNMASQGMQGMTNTDTASGFQQNQNQYLRPNTIDQNLSQGQQYFDQAGQSAAQNVGQYMNPYQQSVLDLIAQQGARNLRENLLPNVADSFVRAGSFGGTRMGEFGSRALRDTQESILNQQAQAAQAGYTQALGAAQTDLSRYGNLAQNLTAAGQAQQGFGLNAAGQLQGAQAGDYDRNIGALTNLATMGQNRASMLSADAAQLETAGRAQTDYQQNLNNENYNRWQQQQDYPWIAAERARNLAQGTSVPTYTTANQFATGSYAPSPYSSTLSAVSAYQGLNEPYRPYQPYQPR